MYTEKQLTEAIAGYHLLQMPSAGYHLRTAAESCETSQDFSTLVAAIAATGRVDHVIDNGVPHCTCNGTDYPH